MPKYKITVRIPVYIDLEIEAETEEEAIELAESLEAEHSEEEAAEFYHSSSAVQVRNIYPSVETLEHVEA
jgi:hypothetical protein